MLAPERTVTVGLPLKMTFKGRADDGYFVTKVSEGGNAASAGITVGSRIIAVNNLSVASLGRKEVTELIIKSVGGIACDLRIVQDMQAFADFRMRTAAAAAAAGKAPTVTANTTTTTTTTAQLAAAASKLRVHQEVKVLVMSPPLGIGFDTLPSLGCFVTKCTPGSEAAKRGVLVGWRIVSVNGVQTVGKPKASLLPIFKQPASAKTPLSNRESARGH